MPRENFFCQIDESLKRVRGKLYQETHTTDIRVRGLSKKWAANLNLSEGITLVAEAFDAHTGAVGAGIKPETLVKIMETSLPVT